MVDRIESVGPLADLLREFQQLGKLLQQTQAQALRASEKLMSVGIQEAVRDASLGDRVDLTT